MIAFEHRCCGCEALSLFTQAWPPFSCLLVAPRRRLFFATSEINSGTRPPPPGRVKSGGTSALHRVARRRIKAFDVRTRLCQYFIGAPCHSRWPRVKPLALHPSVCHDEQKSCQLDELSAVPCMVDRWHRHGRCCRAPVSISRSLAGGPERCQRRCWDV